MLTIKLNQMQFHSHIGFYKEERVIGQDIVINITLHLKDVSLATLAKDDLNNTINYGQVYQIASEVVAKKDTKLVETVASLICKRVWDQFEDKLEHVTVAIQKKGLPIDGVLDNAEVEVSIWRNQILPTSALGVI